MPRVSPRISKAIGLSIEEPGQLFFDVDTDILFSGHWVENCTEFSRICEDWDRDIVDRSDTQLGMGRMVERMDPIGLRDWEVETEREMSIVTTWSGLR